MDLSKLSDKELLEYKNRLEYDSAKYNNIQLAKKEQLVSAYGTIGCPHFRFFDVRLAEAITTSGRFFIKWLQRDINAYLNKLSKTENEDYIVAMDTDSLLITFEKVVDKYMQGKSKNKILEFIDKICDEKIQEVINKSCNEMKEYLNAVTQGIVIKREILSDCGIWMTKKRYIMNVIDKEGVRYAEPELKVVGIEAVRTSTPKIIREKIKECLKIAINGTEADVHSFVKKFRKEFNEAPVEDIASPRSVNGLDKYRSNSDIYIKSTPIQVKGSLIYNYMLKDMKLDKKYEVIKEGEKIKFVYLKEPNPIQDTVIAFLNVLPKEFNIHKYVDYDIQFQKTFIEPMSNILEHLGWTVEKKKSLSVFFVD